MLFRSAWRRAWETEKEGRRRRGGELGGEGGERGAGGGEGARGREAAGVLGYLRLRGYCYRWCRRGGRRSNPGVAGGGGVESRQWRRRSRRWRLVLCDLGGREQLVPV